MHRMARYIFSILSLFFYFFFFLHTNSYFTNYHLLFWHIKHQMYIVFPPFLGWIRCFGMKPFVSLSVCVFCCFFCFVFVLFFYPRSVSLQIFLGALGKVSTHSLRLHTFRFHCLRILCHFPHRCHCSLFLIFLSISGSIRSSLGFWRSGAQFLLSSHLQTRSRCGSRLLDVAGMWLYFPPSRNIVFVSFSEPAVDKKNNVPHDVVLLLHASEMQDGRRQLLRWLRLCRVWLRHRAATTRQGGDEREWEAAKCRGCLWEHGQVQWTLIRRAEIGSWIAGGKSRFPRRPRCPPPPRWAARKHHGARLDQFCKKNVSTPFTVRDGGVYRLEFPGAHLKRSKVLLLVLLTPVKRRKRRPTTTVC